MQMMEVSRFKRPHLLHHNKIRIKMKCTVAGCDKVHYKVHVLGIVTLCTLIYLYSTNFTIGTLLAVLY